MSASPEPSAEAGGLNFLDCGFNWNELNGDGQHPTEAAPCTMAYGFGGANMDGYSSDQGYAQKDSTFVFTFFDMGGNDVLNIDQLTISVKKVSGDNNSPFDSSFPGQWNLGPGTLSGQSGPLDCTGTAWRTPTYDVVAKGTFAFTLTIQVSDNSGNTRWFSVDPELVVGSKLIGPN